MVFVLQVPMEEVVGKEGIPVVDFVVVQRWISLPREIHFVVEKLIGGASHFCFLTRFEIVNHGHVGALQTVRM